MDPIDNSRRDLLLTPLLAALPLALISGALTSPANASPLNPAQTIIRPPSDLAWLANKGYPENSVDMCPLTGDINQPGLYYTLVRWWPGYMSSPHTYTTDRLCVVVSGPGGATAGPTSTPPVASPSKPAASFAGSPPPRTTTASSRATRTR